MTRRPFAAAAGVASALASLLAPACSFDQGFASDGEIDFSVRGAWFPTDLSGDVKITAGGVQGTGSRIEMNDDLDIDGEDHGLPAFDLYAGGLRAGVEWLPFSFEGRTTLDQSLVFHGTGFPAGNRVASELDLETWKFRVDGALIDDPGFELRAGVVAYWWNFELDLADIDAGVRDSREFSRLLPGVTLSGSFSIVRKCSVGFDAAFATIDEGRQLWDLAALARYDGGGGTWFDAGYRFLRYELNEDTNVGTLDLQGPFLGFTCRF